MPGQSLYVAVSVTSDEAHAILLGRGWTRRDGAWFTPEGERFWQTAEALETILHRDAERGDQLRKAFDEARELARGEAVEACCILLDAVAAHLGVELVIPPDHADDGYRGPTPEEGGLPAGGPSSDTRWQEGR